MKGEEKNNISFIIGTVFIEGIGRVPYPILLLANKYNYIWFDYQVQMKVSVDILYYTYDLSTICTSNNHQKPVLAPTS
jgi:hypothetical protein